MTRKLIAILRGVKPAEVVAIGSALIEQGISTIEVPLNSPEPFKSIQLLIEHFGDQALIGAGTVLSVADVDKVAAAGGQLIVSPNCEPAVITATKSSGLLSYPGVLTPSECFTALQNGADGLKIFPSFVLGPAGLAAMLAVLPDGTETYAVGGVDAENFVDWIAQGASGFGIGSGLYKPGFSVDDIAVRARYIVAAYDSATRLGGKAADGPAS